MAGSSVKAEQLEHIVNVVQVTMPDAVPSCCDINMRVWAGRAPTS